MSDLKLNNSTLPYKEFYGANNEQMHLLIADGRIPISVAGLMKRRLEVLDSGDSELISAWWDNYVDTGNGILYHPDGEVKIVSNAQPFLDMNSESKLSNGALVLGNDRDSSIEVYNSIKGAEFKRSDLGKTGNVLTKDEVKNHPIWQELAGDKNLLSDYADVAFKLGKEKFNYDNMMGVYISSPQKNVVGRLWLVYFLGNYSNADGISYLYNYGGRLVGVAPEARSAKNGKVVKSQDIANNVINYLSSRTALEGVTKKGVLSAVQKAYQ
jgi:hypothetical protein